MITCLLLRSQKHPLRMVRNSKITKKLIMENTQWTFIFVPFRGADYNLDVAWACDHMCVHTFVHAYINVCMIEYQHVFMSLYLIHWGRVSELNPELTGIEALSSQVGPVSVVPRSLVDFDNSTRWFQGITNKRVLSPLRLSSVCVLYYIVWVLVQEIN